MGEKYKAEDDANKNRVEAKNGLENYCYSLKNSISADEVKDKIPEEDKTSLESKIEEIIQWLDANQSAEKEEYDEKQKELEGIALPILQKMGGAGGMPGAMPDMPDMGGSGGAPPGPDPTSGPSI